MSLREATEIGCIVSTLTLMAIKAEPHIADKSTNNIKLFKANFFDRILDFIFWFRNVYLINWLHKFIALTIP